MGCTLQAPEQVLRTASTQFETLKPLVKDEKPVMLMSSSIVIHQDLYLSAVKEFLGYLKAKPNAVPLWDNPQQEVVNLLVAGRLILCQCKSKTPLWPLLLTEAEYVGAASF
ncbi:hypothetical protein Tco_1247607 [Tanacetum coccineum]